MQLNVPLFALHYQFKTSWKIAPGERWLRDITGSNQSELWSTSFYWKECGTSFPWPWSKKEDGSSNQTKCVYSQREEWLTSVCTQWIVFSPCAVGIRWLLWRSRSAAHCSEFIWHYRFGKAPCSPGHPPSFGGTFTVLTELLGCRSRTWSSVAWNSCRFPPPTTRDSGRGWSQPRSRWKRISTD